MKSETNKKLGEKLGRILLSLICFTVYNVLFLAALANSYDTDLTNFLLG